MSDKIMLSRRFAPLFWCQFFAAFNDNFLKNAAIMLIMFRIAGSTGDSLITLAGAVLVAPYFVVSAVGGQIADRFDKSVVIRRLKLAEVAATGVAVAGFVTGSVPTLFAAMFLFGALGAAFGPAKYSILPDHLSREELPVGNALIEGATFMAILAGTVAGGVAMHGGDMAVLAVAMVGFSLASYAAAWFIPAAAPAAAGTRIDANVFRSTFELLGGLWRDRRVWNLAVVTSLFWLVGIVAMSALAPLVTRVLHGSDVVVTIHFAVFAVAVAAGSGLAAFLLAGRILMLPAAVGALLIAVAAADVAFVVHSASSGASDALAPSAYFAQPRSWRVLFDLAVAAVSGGLMVVPALAGIQSYADPARRSREIAAVNVLNAAFMTAGSVVVAVAQRAGAPVESVFAAMSVVALASSVWIVRCVVESPFRDFLSILFRAVYRMEVKGLENLKDAGPNPVIALNHVSFLDAGMILSALPFAPVFAVDRSIATRWWVRPFLRFVKAIPLDPAKPLGTRVLVNAVKAGSPLVIFPEGRLTATGSLMKVYDGTGLVVEKTGSMVVPVRIEGPEATIFSRLGRAQVRRRWFPKFTLTVLPPTRLVVDDALKGRQRRMAAGSALYSIMSDLVFRTSKSDGTVFDAVVRAARLHGWGRVAVEDPLSGALTYRRLLTAARALGKRLSTTTRRGEAVGVMLPNSNGAAATILGLMSAGRVPAMVNFTAGSGSILSGCKGARVDVVLTSRAFVEKGKLDRLVAQVVDGGVRVEYLEDLRSAIGPFDRLLARVGSSSALVVRRAEDPAVILFTSGSEGVPKGVVLSNGNLLANVAQAAARIDFGRTDKVFNVLPVFHCFGLNAGFLLPLVSGVPVYLYPSPLHYKMVPELAYATNATILFGTDTFLTGYARVAHPYDFRSIRYVLAGAEPVKASTRKAYAEKFGLRILEGYGVTEAAPILALNTPLFNRYGTVGRLMPGIEWRLDRMPGVEAGGRLFVRGPNVMLGYLKADAPGVLQSPEDGWYDTGDIVEIDADGFVSIKGRAKRFVKVGGEMVSLAAVEALAGELWPGVASAASGSQDPRKGERIVLVTAKPGATRGEFLAFAKGRGASELSVPSEVMVVDAVPMLGSGKLDFAAVDRVVRARAGSSAGSSAPQPSASPMEAGV